VANWVWTTPPAEPHLAGSPAPRRARLRWSSALTARGHAGQATLGWAHAASRAARTKINGLMSTRSGLRKSSRLASRNSTTVALRAATPAISLRKGARGSTRDRRLAEPGRGRAIQKGRCTPAVGLGARVIARKARLDARRRKRVEPLPRAVRGLSGHIGAEHTSNMRSADQCRRCASPALIGLTAAALGPLSRRHRTPRGAWFRGVLVLVSRPTPNLRPGLEAGSDAAD
jgi:hypothetical protein